MKLAEFLATNHLSLREFARRCGTSASSILRARDGLAVPSRRILNAIHRETAGQVGPADLILAGEPDHTGEEDGEHA
ncbi:MAG: hypothetical protein JNK19_03810 [Tabrizicola sp.]|nr:hypothetical protein [Tabrizicola sp.]